MLPLVHIALLCIGTDLSLVSGSDHDHACHTPGIYRYFLEHAHKGRHFCMPASMGMFLLTGNTVNNSILLLNFIKTARQQGKTLDEAIEGAIYTTPAHGRS
jgi:hypothetical protein